MFACKYALKSGLHPPILQEYTGGLTGGISTLVDGRIKRLVGVQKYTMSNGSRVMV